MKYIIYKHTNKINNKSYIGQTCKAEDPNLRWCNGKGYSKCRKFYNAIKKYGWENFSHDIIAEAYTAEEADELEKQYIKSYDSINNGYNITFGGAGRHEYRPILQLDTNKKIIAKFTSVSEAEVELNLPIYHSNITLCCKGKLRTSHGYCWCYEDEYESYQIKVPKEKKLFRVTSEIYQLDRHKNIIAKYPSALAAYKALKNNPDARNGSYVITDCCKAKRSCAYGYWWCFAEDYPTFIPKLSYYQQKVAQLDMSSESIIAVYDNLAEAAKAVNGTSSKIGQACRGNIKSSCGYLWRFVELSEELKLEETNKNDLCNSGGR